MAQLFQPPLSFEEVEAALENYSILDVLGDGGQGVVFQGENSKTGQQVAIKVYSPQQMIKRAELEVEKLEKMNSPFLAKVVEHNYSTLRGENCYYVVTEYIEGKDLKKVLEERDLTPEEVKTLMKHMLLALEQLWQSRVVHCDIKPPNILYLESNEFVLIDLGYAKHLDSETITMAGYIMGTPGYMAPEHLKGRKNLTVRADMFALGIIAYEALTGIHPFANNQNLIFTNHKALPIEEHVEVDKGLAKAINWMLNTNPIRRPVSTQQVLRLIQEGE